MFRGLINDAKAAAGSLIVKYLARASVAVPFVVAVAFATAAVTFMLADRFGGVIAAWIVAGGYTIVGLMMALIVTVKEQEEEIAQDAAETTGTQSIAAEVAVQAASQAPLAMLGMIMSTLGPSTIAGGAKMMGRNIPLVVLLALIAMLFWPSDRQVDGTGDDAALAEGKLNGAHAPAADGYRAEAA